MFNPIKTWADEIYEKGFNAGYNKRKAEEREEDTHTLHDVYRRGYRQGMDDALAELEEIDIKDVMKEVANEYMGSETNG